MEFFLTGNPVRTVINADLFFILFLKFSENLGDLKASFILLYCYALYLTQHQPSFHG